MNFYVAGLIFLLIFFVCDHTKKDYINKLNLRFFFLSELAIRALKVFLPSCTLTSEYIKFLRIMHKINKITLLPLSVGGGGFIYDFLHHIFSSLSFHETA